ncbi:MAG: hypothetical protein GY789_27195 [Hyphomicrobiales bacterium]|nr:hypothetical protein [Hyphomicrobiales bacterium]MCP5000147.1 hypothetical protein [Hyphomicrobiales bacterium]
MVREKKSYDLHVDLPSGVEQADIFAVVERACETIGLYISHIGSYSRNKYPNSVHWHFKRDKKEAGLIDATFRDVKSLLSLMIRYSEPEWVHSTAPLLQAALERELQRQCRR